MPNLISIDWDFFTLNQEFERKVWNDDHTDWMPGPFAYDWQMSETRNPAFEHEIWCIRASNLRRFGLDPIKATRPMLDPDDFITEISVRFPALWNPSWLADSHAWAAILLRQLSQDVYDGEPFTVWNFDAHHDLGYAGERSKGDDAEAEPLDCGNWAWHGLREGWLANYNIVYPEFRGKKEWAGGKRPWLDGFNVNVFTWEEFLRDCEPDESRDLHGIFMCRSSSWTAPWQDNEFQKLLDEYDPDCLDCSHKEFARYNACTPREWDWADVAERERMIDEMMELHKQQKAETK